MRDRLAEAVRARERALTVTLEGHRDAIARACLEMARAFAGGGTLIAFGTGAAATDAAHVAVEFMHPVIVGKRALPALAPTNDPTGGARTGRLARPGDIALGLCHGPRDPAVEAFLDEARAGGLLTIAMTGAGGAPRADHVVVVAADDPEIVQEVQETVYHVLWELVHVFFEHPGLLEDGCADGRCTTCGDVAVQGRVVEVRPRAAVVEVGGRRQEVAIDLLDAVAVGDELLCHAGVALQRAEGVGG